MMRDIIIYLVIFLTIARAYVNALADEQYKKNYAQIDFDKMDYDDSRQKDFEVIIKEVWKAPWKHDSGASTGIYMEVACGKKSYLVPVAPGWYFEDTDRFKIEEKITILGVESVLVGKRIILPRLIKNGSRELWIRNYDGKPFWLITSKNDNFRKMSPGGQRGPGQGGPGGGGGKPPF
ncbi:MAG: hypothetical protein V1874_00345 [Spirochaetota bacterium]